MLVKCSERCRPGHRWATKRGRPAQRLLYGLTALTVGVLSGGTHALASPEGLRACTLPYLVWSNSFERKLRRTAVAGASSVAGGDWCASDSRVVGELKTQLFSLQAPCSDVTPEEHAEVVKLIAQSLRSLKAVTVCPSTATPSFAPLPPSAQPVAPSTGPSTGIQVSEPVPKAKPATPRAVVVRAEAPKPTETAKATVRPVVAPKPTAKVVPVQQAKEKAAAAILAPSFSSSDIAGTYPKEVRVAVVPPRSKTPSPAAAGAAPPQTAPRIIAQADTPIIVTTDAVSGGGRLLAPTPAEDAAVEIGECLLVRQSQPGKYVIDVSRCQSRSVIAAVELPRSSPGPRCIRQSFWQNVTIASADSQPPVINFQCLSGEDGCSAEILAEMFPECGSG